MKEMLQEMAGERRGSLKKQFKSKNDITSHLRNLSGLHEEFGEDAIYIHESRDVEKFYSALIEAFEGNKEATNIVKDIFSTVRY